MLVYLDSHGCAKNQVDAEQMLAILTKEGWQISEEAEPADLVIVNSCGFIESAKKESIDAVLAWRNAYPNKKILLAGCLSQRYTDELAQDLHEADFLFGNADLSKIGQAVRQTMDGSARSLRPTFVHGEQEQAQSDSALCSSNRPLLSLPGSAYLKISEGCNNNCTYCAIPLIRGPLRSRPATSILAEAKSLIARGVKEICLVGQDLGSWGSDLGIAGGLPALLQELLALEADIWIRLLYIHPDHFPYEIIDLCKMSAEKNSGPRLLPYFDIPFQHASAKILKLMGRKGSAEEYLKLIKNIRSALPQATVRSTFLLGFPGENNGDLALLADFQQRATLDWLGAFSYSREEDTAAYKLAGRPSKRQTDARRKKIEEAQVPITFAQMERYVGQRMDILIEEEIQGDEGLWLGRAICQAPEVDGATVISSFEPLTLGSILPCYIRASTGYDLDAVPLNIEENLGETAGG